MRGVVEATAVVSEVVPEAVSEVVLAVAEIPAVRKKAKAAAALEAALVVEALEEAQATVDQEANLLLLGSTMRNPLQSEYLLPVKIPERATGQGASL
jgi:hypothetical protein